MKTTDEIYAELKSDFESASGLTLSDGGDMSLRFLALAAQLYTLYCEAEYVMTQTVPQTATGENLDSFAELRGLTRTAATKATGTLKFTAASGVAASVPKGTRCKGDNGSEYVTVEAGSISVENGCCELAAEAVVGGADGNAAANSVRLMMLAPEGVVSCTNPLAFSGGKDAESDASLRRRVLESYKSMINGGSAAHYKALAMTVPNVVAANVIPKNRGVGTVDVVIATHENAQTASAVNAVQSLLDENREVCVDVKVKAPISAAIAVEATVKAKSGYVASTVADEVKTALQNYFCAELLGCDITRAELSKVIYSVDGVQNYTLTQPAEDVETAANELPIIGMLSVTGV